MGLQVFDVLVVGGGIDGAGIARDLARAEAELHCLRDEEWATTADDVLWRRSKLGLHCTDAQRRSVAAWMAPVQHRATACS